jgi:hypothetical protein
MTYIWYFSNNKRQLPILQFYRGTTASLTDYNVKTTSYAITEGGAEIGEAASLWYLLELNKKGSKKRFVQVDPPTIIMKLFEKF